MRQSQFKTLILVFLTMLGVNAHAQTSPFNYAKSGYLYSDFTLMFTRTAGAGYTQAFEFNSQWAWAPLDQNRTNVYFYPSPSAGYQETFRRSGDFILLEGYADRDANGHHQYIIQTEYAAIYIGGRWIDITNLFRGGPIPYALENMPNESYRIYTRYHYAHVLNGVLLPTDYSSSVTWHVSYSAPALVSSVHAGSQLGTIQSEQYSKHPYNRFDQTLNFSSQTQAICYRAGLACWRSINGHVDGTLHRWNW